MDSGKWPVPDSPENMAKGVLMALVFHLLTDKARGALGCINDNSKVKTGQSFFFVFCLLSF